MEREQLTALLTVPGALKIITSEIRPDLRLDASNPRSEIDPDKALAELERLGLPSHARVEIYPSTFVLHDVTELEDRPDGKVIARTAEGDYTVGQPAAVLKRLTEWSR